MKDSLFLLKHLNPIIKKNLFGEFPDGRCGQPNHLYFKNSINFHNSILYKQKLNIFYYYLKIFVKISNIKILKH